MPLTLNPQFKISPNFTVAELTVSQTAARRGIKNTVSPGGAVHQNLKSLCVNILEPLENAGAVISISSAFRCKKVNALVGGSSTSHHVFGRAADITARGYTPMSLCRKIVEMDLPFDELILEFGRWTHVAVAANIKAPRRKIMTAKKRNGKTVYLPGLVE